MTTNENQQASRGGIVNVFYGINIQIINIKLTEEQIAVLGSGNQLATNISNMINNLSGNNYEK